MTRFSYLLLRARLIKQFGDEEKTFENILEIREYPAIKKSNPQGYCPIQFSASHETLTWH